METYKGSYTLFMRQVDDFAIATGTEDTAKQIIADINEHIRLPIKFLGKVTRFNGMDIEQTKEYVKVHCSTYLSKLGQAYKSLIDTYPPLPNQPIPFHADPAYLKKLIHLSEPQTPSDVEQLEQRMGIKFRRVMGEIMFPMVKCRPDISPHAIILSQFMNNPSEIHFQAVKDVLRYLVHTHNAGTHYWRDIPHPQLPLAERPTPHPDNNHTVPQQETADPSVLCGYVDSDWATNTRKRTSMTGMIVMFAGGAVGYKSKFQPVIAHSSTEAEFVAACDTAKHILFYRSLLAELGIEQHHATVLFKDNNGALLMANAQQPTRRTRHMEIKHFALLDWVEQDMVILKHINTSNNTADTMTKTLSKNLFYRHYDSYMGFRIPKHCAKETLAPNPMHTFRPSTDVYRYQILSRYLYVQMPLCLP